MDKKEQREEWYRHSFRRLHLDFHFPEHDSVSFQELNSKKFVSLLEDSHVDSVVVFTKGHWGNSYYDTKIGHKHKALGERDFFGEVLSEARNKGIKVIAYHSILWDMHMANSHPEWTMKDARNRPIRTGDKWIYLCPNSPYADYLLAQLDEISRNYDPDGFWLDIISWPHPMGFCLCDYCSTLYNKTTGKQLLEPLVSREDKLMHLNWRKDNIESFVERMRSVIHKNLPNIPLIHNYHGYPYFSTSSGHRAVFSDKSEYTTAEDLFGNEALALLPEFLQAANREKAIEVIVNTCCAFYADWTIKPVEQLRYEVQTLLAHNATSSMFDEPHPNGRFEPQLYRAIGEVYREAKSLEHYCEDGRIIDYAAVYFSDKSRTFYYIEGKENEYLTTFCGAYQLLLEEHVPAKIVLDEKMDLSRFKVLIIPEAIVLSDEELEHFKDFAKNGGTILVTGAFGNYKEDYRPRHNPFRILGLEGEERSDYTHTFIHPTDDEIFNYLSYTLDLFQRGSYDLKAVSGDSLAFLSLPVFKAEEGKLWLSHGPEPPGPMSEIPAIQSTSVGKGKTIYINGNPYYEHAVQSLTWPKELIRGLLEKMAPPQPFYLDAPSTVEMVIRQNKQRYFIHLINYHSRKQMKTGVWGETRNLERIEEIVPVHNITICSRFPIKEAVTHEGEKLQVLNTRGGHQIKIPKIKSFLILEICVDRAGT